MQMLKEQKRGKEREEKLKKKGKKKLAKNQAWKLSLKKK